MSQFSTVVQRGFVPGWTDSQVERLMIVRRTWVPILCITAPDKSMVVDNNAQVVYILCIRVTTLLWIMCNQAVAAHHWHVYGFNSLHLVPGLLACYHSLSRSPFLKKDSNDMAEQISAVAIATLEFALSVGTTHTQLRRGSGSESCEVSTRQVTSLNE